MFSMKTLRKRCITANTTKKLKKRPITRKKNAPGRPDRTGVSLTQLFEMFPDEASARAWFKDIRWGADGRFCPHCWSENTTPVPHEKPMPCRCSDCRRSFSIRTDTVMQSSRLPLRTWVLSMYLMSTSLKGVSSMKIHRDFRRTGWTPNFYSWHERR